MKMYTLTRLGGRGLRWAALGLLLATAGVAHAQTPVTYSYTAPGGAQTYTVPAGVTQLQVVATGAAGGQGYPSNNGALANGYGAQVQATVTVTPGEMLTVVVGGQGAGGANYSNAGGFNGGGAGTTGGGGGGTTDLRRTYSASTNTGDYLTSRNALLVAGGGGGGTAANVNAIGGAGGTPTGGNGTNNGPGFGYGATTAGPGAGGGRGAGAGTMNTGGAGENISGGSGGGGGYYGGGGAFTGGGGGGGSSFVTPTGSSNISYSVATAVGNGALTITPVYTPIAFRSGTTVLNVTNTSAAVFSNLIRGSALTSYGFVYVAGLVAPALGNMQVQVGTSLSSYPADFSATLPNLTPGTTYTVRPYATNSGGTFYGSPETFTTVQAVTAAPVVTAPTNNSTTNASPLASFTAPANSIVTVSITGLPDARYNVDPTGNVSIRYSGLAQGTYMLSATAQSSGQAMSAQSNVVTFTVDATPPAVVSFNRQNPMAAVTNAMAVTYRLTFSEAIMGLTSNNLSISFAGGIGSNTTRLTTTAVSASVYDITLSGLVGSGVTSLSLNSSRNITDLVGNNLPDLAVNSPTYTIDQTAPTATLTTTAGSSTSTSPIPFSVTFSEPVTGFSASGISVLNGTIASGPTGTGSGPFTFSVTPASNGPLAVSIAANAAQDAAGNGSTASGTTSVMYAVPVVSGLSVQYQTGDLGQPTDGQVRPFLQLVNSGTTAVPYSSLTVRYWLTVENFMGQLVTPIDYAKLGTSFVSARYVQLATPRQGALGYIEYSFAAGAGNLAAGTDSGPIYGKAYKPDYTSLDETDDWSYQTSSSFTENSHVTVYQNGTLVNGTEPAAVTATTALQVFVASRDAATSTQYLSLQLQVRNTGNLPVNYGDVKVRYYFTRDGATSVVPQVDYAKLGNNNVSLRVVNLAAPVSGADAYLEVTFSAALGVFYPRTSTDDILVKLRKDNYQAFDQSNDYTFSGSTMLTANPRFPAYVGNQLFFGTPPAGAPAVVASTEQTSARATGGGEEASTSIVAAAGASRELTFTGSPNPFSEQLHLTFALSTTQAYTLAVYDGQGRLVQQLAQGQAEAGRTQELAVPTQRYATGLYLVRLTTATGVQTLKLIKQ